MEIKTCKLNDIQYRYSDSETKSRQTLVFVGGAFQSINKLGPLATHWENHYRFISIELPGFGDSDYLSSHIGFDFTASCIENVFETCKLKDALIVGTSYGAPSVFRFAIRNESSLKGMILGGACPSISPFMEYQVRFLLWMLRSENKAWLFPKAFTEVMCNTKIDTIPNSNRIQQIVMRSLLKLDDTGREKFIANSYRLLKESMPSANLKVPTLVFTGEYDNFTPASRLKEFRKFCSKLEIATIRNSDHMYHLEQTDKTLDLIDDFVCRLDSKALKVA